MEIQERLIWKSAVDGTWAFTHGDFWFTDAIQMTIREDGKIVLLLINSGSNTNINGMRI